MKDIKNIDDFFNSKLSDLRVQAPDDAWDNISARLNKKSNFLGGYWKFLAASVALLLAFGTGYFVSFKHFNPKLAQDNTLIHYKDTLQSKDKSEDIKIPIYRVNNSEKENTSQNKKAKNNPTNGSIKERTHHVQGERKTISTPALVTNDCNRIPILFNI